ncbi:MAG: LysR family transcriptional regulator [Pseudomonadota bacterium]
MDFELLEDFLAVLEHGSILAAAEASGASQPTLSRKMRELEDTLGVLLFNRTSRGISPTVYGSMFKQHAEQLLQNRQIALDELRALKNGQHGHARIGLAPALSGYLPGVIRKLRLEKPGVTFEVIEGTYDTLVQKTLKGEIEGAFTMLPPGESVESLAVRPLADESIVVVADPDHPLFAIEQPGPSDLENEAWIVMNRPRSIIDGFYQIADTQGLASPHIAIETSSLGFLKSFLIGSTLLTALPKGAVHTELDDGSLRALNLANLPSVKTAFVHRHGVMPPLVTQIVHELELAIQSRLATPTS